MNRINSGTKGMSIQGITATATATTPKIWKRVCNTIEINKTLFARSLSFRASIQLFNATGANIETELPNLKADALYNV